MKPSGLFINCPLGINQTCLALLLLANLTSTEDSSTTVSTTTTTTTAITVQNQNASLNGTHIPMNVTQSPTPNNTANNHSTSAPPQSPNTTSAERLNSSHVTGVNNTRQRVNATKKGNRSVKGKAFLEQAKDTVDEVFGKLQILKSAFNAGYKAKELEITLGGLFSAFLEGGRILLNRSSASKIAEKSALEYGDTGYHFHGTIPPYIEASHLGLLSFYPQSDRREIIFNWTGIDSDSLINPEDIEPWDYTRNSSKGDPEKWYCIGRDQRKYNNVHKKTIKGVSCNMEQETTFIHISNMHYDNIIVATPLDSPVLIIHYLTTNHYLSARNCHMRAINLPCVKNVAGNMTGWWTSVDDWFNPVTTLVIDRTHHDNSECILRFCAMRKTKEVEKGVWETRRFPVEVTLNDGHLRSTRKLLTVRDSQQTSKLHSKCTSNSTLIPFKSATSLDDKGAKKGSLLTFCNGTRVTNLPLSEFHGCYSVSVKKSYFQCSSITKHNNCSVSKKLFDCEQDKCLEVGLTGMGKVRVVRGLKSHTQICRDKCLVPTFSKSSGDLIIYCPGNQQHVLESNLIDISCPLHDWAYGIPLYICRASHKPHLVYTWLAIILLGYPCSYLVLILFRLVLIILCKVLRLSRLRFSKKGKGSCSICNDTFCCPLDYEVHEGACTVQICPYCSTRFTKEQLKTHNHRCVLRSARKADLLALYTYQITPWFLSYPLLILKTSTKLLAKLSWSCLLVVIFTFLVSPVSSLSTGSLPKDYWDKTVELINQCDSYCTETEEMCYCSNNEEQTGYIARKPLSLQEVYGKMKKALTLEKTVNLHAPWGLLHIESTYTPSSSIENINLSWDSEEEIGDKVLLSGKSTGILKLVEKTGTSWSLSSSKASESRTLTVSILDFTQQYKTEFIYLTGDRLVSDWSHGACTGNCPPRCGCDSRTCRQMQWLHARNWGCNPTWCWGVKTGCTCCAVDVEQPFDDFMVILMKTEYVSTDIAACVELNSEERECAMVSAGIEFETGPVTVTFSDPNNIVDRLPQQVALVYQKDKKTGRFDIGHPDLVTTANNLCKVQSCSHGGVGDYQMFSIDHLVKEDVVNLHFIKADKLTREETDWMSWQGVETSYYCNPGAWPTCTNTGIVKQNKEAFKNLHKIERILSDSFVLQTNRVSTNHSTLTWDVKAKPRSGAGEISVYINVEGLQLHSKKISLYGLRLTVLECSGCFGCTTGISCRFTVTLKSPESFAVHLLSNSEHVLVAKTTVIARHPETPDSKPQTVKLFSPIKVDEICLSIEEWGLCRDCAEEGKLSCVKVNLKKPESIMLENRGTIKTSANETCGTGTVTCWASSVGNFFKNLGGFFGSMFGSWVKGIILFVSVAAVIALLIFFGPSKLKLLLCCVRRPRYTRLETNDTNDSPVLKDISRSVKEGKIKAVMEQLRDKGAFSHLSNI
ncbi:glycoprotein precursor [Orthonairovirus sakhalinense]|uniref:M polyprotein n=1 Tax=Orthonairovirus sakhalinense TaxID=3052534 RepID=A0A191KWC6_9VIRU|nr:glycoprotein precursor [Orthonairovirus sakhalinense]